MADLRPTVTLPVIRVGGSGGSGRGEALSALGIFTITSSCDSAGQEFPPCAIGRPVARRVPPRFRWLDSFGLTAATATLLGGFSRPPRHTGAGT
jgi:hypothetical protein